MFIAGLSLYYAVDAQKRDLEYKEISIQPRTSLLPLFEGLSLTLRNLGLGPAVIKQIDFEQNGKCVSSYDKELGEWQKIYGDFLKAVAAEVYTKSLPPMPWIKGGKPQFDYEVDTLQFNDTIRASEDRWLFHLAPGTLKEFLAANSAEQVATSDRFARLAYAVPIIITACSATGRTCMSVGEAKACEYLHIARPKKN